MKEKLLASAQKNLEKGQIAKAVKDFQLLVGADPKDFRSRQKLAELYIRLRQNEQALEEYARVARHYADTGFYLKAIAVYKQMQKLDPAQPEIYLQLAELNQKQGLLGNAQSEYRTLALQYEEKQLFSEAVGILKRIKEIDPDDLNTRARIVETSLKAQLPTAARAELAELIQLLLNKNDLGRALKTYDHFLPHFPEDVEIKSGLAELLIRRGEGERAIALLEGLLKNDPAEPKILRILAAAFRQAGEFQKERLICQQLLQAAPDDLEIRELLIRASLDQKEWECALDELEEWKEAFFRGGKVELLKTFYQQLQIVRPTDGRVLGTLQSIYELSGDGEKVLALLAAKGESGLSPTGEPQVASEELLDISVLDEAVEDLEEIAELIDECEDLGEELAEEIPLQFLEAIRSAPAAPADPIAPIAPIAPAAPALELELDLDLDDLDLELELEGGFMDDLPAYFAPGSESAGANESSTSPATEVATALQPAGGKPKKGIKTEVEVEDPESHYHLGIAYKEMGLLDEAIKELEKAMVAPARAADCLMLKGLCLMEQGALAEAEEVLKEGLNRPDLVESEKVSLHFELGSVYESLGRLADALDSFQHVAGYDLFFRQVGERIADLRRRLDLDPAAQQPAGGKKNRISYV